MIDVWILGGYLGAGKTTMLNAMLAGGEFAGKEPALIINEFGKIGVDGALVERRELKRFEINKGSLFCICTKTDFLKALCEIAAGGRHKAVLIEATGIAEPVDIENFLTEGPNAGFFCLRGNLCVVDAVHFTQVAAYLKPAVSQVRWADAIVVNKCDLADKTGIRTLREILKQLNPAAPVTETSFGKIDGDFLNAIVHRGHKEEFVSCAPEKIFAISFGTNGPVDRGLFEDAIVRLGTNILRLKGNVSFADGPAFVEVVCGQIIRKQLLASLAECTGSATAFTVIAWNADKEAIRQSFERCFTA